MKSNSNIYPYIPFADLSHKDIKNNIVAQKEISFKKLKEIVLSLNTPRPAIKGQTTAEKILSIFLDKNFLFGPADYIKDNKKIWLQKLNYFINKNKTIQFTILALPFKIPVPLKTNRILPDLGEILFLLRLHLITELIGKIYKPGARITILAEDIFADFVGVNHQTATNYYQTAKNLNRKLGFDDKIKIIPLSLIKKYVNNFDKVYKQKVTELKKLYQAKDRQFLQKYSDTYNILCKIVAPPKVNKQILLDIYNDNLSDRQVKQAALKIRKQIRAKAHQAVFQYFAFFSIRDEIDLLNQLSPHSLTLSVSPKKNRLGIIPVNKNCTRLPYHAVPVWYKNKITLEYLIDLKRDKNKYTAIYLKNDKDKTPFYYIAYEK